MPRKHVSRIREWIQACNEFHGDVCVPKAKSRPLLEDIPSWLIDTHQLCIVAGSSANRYLALSYVWPEPRKSAMPTLEELLGGPQSRAPPPRTLLLDGTTISDLQVPGSLSSEFAERIPAVIKYAIELTMELKERYLWVDRLCIVQDDSEAGGTKSEVGRMDKIYAGAYLTIIAAAPDDMYIQTLAKGWPNFASHRVPNTDSRPDNKCTDGDQLDIGKITHERYRSLARSKWASRGWYQEQILCGRSVALLDDGVLWDCQTCVWDGVDLHPGEMISRSKVHTNKGQRDLTRWWPDFELYLDLLCPYNGRQFSYSQDALAGFQGILNTLENSFPGGFLYGLPRVFLDHSLLWQPFGSAARRTDRREDGVVRSSLPSWSWCGW
ncbi:heterokaryon incompatibility protein-domain-containing protein, partial [Phaeosphaeria sp. MPI-PUGE-AT-0046c]